MATYEDLKTIEASDPDGGERQPTDDDYKAHEQWARAQFGDTTWETYKRGGWGREPGYHTEGGIDYDDDGRW